MDKTIRRNEICVIGLPRCDFVFSSTRICFIAYGYEESPFEKAIIRRLLEERGIQPVEAGGFLAPGQNAFCAKICSKIVVSQFCTILINNKVVGEQEIPNANVYTEYGMMLGFNKYIIPFQRASQKLPFNVAGLDTIKYSDHDFERLAANSIDQAIRETQQELAPGLTPDQVQATFLLTKRALITPMSTQGDRDLFQLGAPLGFNLLNDFSGLNYMFFGNFTSIRPEVAIWRVKMLIDILEDRRASLETRVKAGVVSLAQAHLLDEMLGRLQIWILLTTSEDKQKVTEALAASRYRYDFFPLRILQKKLKSLGKPTIDYFAIILASKCLLKAELGTKPSLGIIREVLTTVILRERSDRRISKYQAPSSG